VDANGQRCPTFQERVDFEVNGPGIWRGGYNSGKTNSINNSCLDLECGINRVAVRSTPTAGAITLQARCGALKPATITLNSQPVPHQDGASPRLPRVPALPELKKPSYDAAVEVAADTREELAPVRTRYIKSFSYSGPTTSVSVQADARDGAKIYTDRDYSFTSLPEMLKGSDWVQTANADKLFSAVDLIELAPSKESTVYVAHDDRLPRPDWLQRIFKPTEISLVIDGITMKLFERKLSPGESLTLGSNTENRNLKSCNMYLVFVAGATSGSIRNGGSGQ
jgi:beta-galactosidase